MSKCISSHGEYSSHENDERYVCKWCGTFDEAEVLKRLEAAEAKAERTAATAAVERVRAIHQPVDIEPSETICGECSFKLPNGTYFGKVEEWPCQTLAALDGAPEPEWEYEVRNEVHDFKSDYTPDLEQAKRWAQEDVHDFIVRRRKAGPWLPVEGERKP